MLGVFAGYILQSPVDKMKRFRTCMILGISLIASGLVLDVWENEPDIDCELLKVCDIATPHIAGYSADGKARGTAMVIDELSRHFDLGITGWEASNIPAPANPEIRINCQGLPAEDILKAALLGTYNVMEDDQKLRMNPSDFEKFRGDYPPRREFKAYTLVLDNGSEEIKHTGRKLGFNIS
jgi:erythronate-4-phosphate dehydrogenase